MSSSRKVQIAIAALANVAEHQQAGAVPLSRLTGVMPASVSYLEQIFGALRRHGLVTGFRGVGGGYRLARPAEQITVAQITAALDTQGAGDCLLTSAGSHQQGLSDDPWCELLSRMHAQLEGITLADLRSRRKSAALAA
jgi:Rrf2 family iron-sulfur cluster assembly transcriptional regulator